MRTIQTFQLAISSIKTSPVSNSNSCQDSGSGACFSPEAIRDMRLLYLYWVIDAAAADDDDDEEEEEEDEDDDNDDNKFWAINVNEYLIVFKLTTLPLNFCVTTSMWVWPVWSRVCAEL